MSDIMKNWITLFFVVIFSVLFVLGDISGSDISANTFGFPILMIGSLGIPSIIKIIKNRTKG